VCVSEEGAAKKRSFARAGDGGGEVLGGEAWMGGCLEAVLGGEGSGGLGEDGREAGLVDGGKGLMNGEKDAGKVHGLSSRCLRRTNS
jgi:hypothetical protein